ncbi:putative laccase [Medicago truncatula]|uniref:Putative laccase n=1 Tax=Medicago truncatula TaxID=3880 RepID=A0A396I7W5_MEDTR|nr:putative laccase [Medicago truncatula]
MGYLKQCSVLLLVVLLVACANGEDPYRFYNWNVTYGDIYPLGVKQQGILINGKFPGPQIESVTNDNLIINVFNSLDEPFLISWLFLFHVYSTGKALVADSNIIF